MNKNLGIFAIVVIVVFVTAMVVMIPELEKEEAKTIPQRH